MALSIGDTLPEAKFAVVGTAGPEIFDLNDFAADKKMVLIGVPGAFTPTCHGNHLPGFLDHLDQFKQKGIDAFAVIAVNDPFVMEQWEKASGGKDKIHFLADGAAHFTKAIGMDIDLSDFGMGVRSNRYSIVLENGEVTHLNIEETPKEATKAGAVALLKAL